MKIGLVVRRLGPMGGTERVAWGFAQWLSERGEEVHTWTLEGDRKIPGVEDHRSAWVGRGRLAHQLAMWRHAQAARAGGHDVLMGLVRVPGVDLYRAGGGCHHSSLGGRMPGPADRLELRLEAETISLAKRVVVNSRMVWGQLQERHELPDERLRLVYNGVDLERFRPSPAGPSRPEGLLFIGNGWTRKGLATALEMLTHLPGRRMLIAGQEHRRERWLRHARHLGVADRVRIVGPVERPEVLLSEVGVVVLPTRYDPFANVVLEALACGTPVVSSGRNGASEILPQPWLRVEDPTDAKGFAAAVERALLEPGLREDCRHRAEQHPASAVHQGLHALLQELR